MVDCAGARETANQRRTRTERHGGVIVAVPLDRIGMPKLSPARLRDDPDGEVRVRA
jgi:hypothetical protein